MKIHFNGAARTVTGSQFLIEVNGSRLLLECGLFQGRRSETYERNLNFAYDPRSLDAVVLSHAHIDHSGNLPNLVKNGYEGPIYATKGTAALCEIMLRDSGHIQEADIAWINKRRRKRGQELIEPLYTIPDAEVAIKQFNTVGYNQPYEPIPGVVVTHVEAGHILGSSSIILDITENGSKKRLWFSGDIGRVNLPLVRDPVMPENVDYLMMECTYGDKTHRDPNDAYEEFCQVVKRTIKRGGKVIIPAFAVGRTQEIVYQLNRFIAEGGIPRIPVYVDSPLATSASDIFRMFPQYFDEEAHEFMHDTNRRALFFDGLTYTRSVEESKAINKDKRPMVILSASGMAETGRILHHLRNNIEDGKNTIMIVSWQAPHTLGRRLAEQVKEVKIFGEKHRRRAEVSTIGGFSAHAGQQMLIDYALASKKSLKHVFLVHGEDRGAEPLMEKLREQGMDNVSYPDVFESVEI